MPIYVNEVADSRETQAGDFETSQIREYTVEGTDDHAAAVAALEDPANVPARIAVRNDGTTIPRVRINPRHTGPELWVATVEYSSISPDAFGFDIGGGTQHILVNEHGPTFRYAPSGQVAPDFGGLINYDGENVNGVDVPAGSLKQQFTRKLKFPGAIEGAYIETLVLMVHAVNTGWFYGLHPGEALFLGAHGYFNSGNWELTLTWAGSYNRSNFTAGGIDIEFKAGWDYLWFFSRRDDDAQSRSLIPRPIAAYVEQLQPRRGFEVLGIGTMR